MKFNLDDAIEVLSRTPSVLNAMLAGLPDEWTKQNEGPETWSPYDVVGHLAHGERTDWIARLKMILEYGESRTFEPFDRFAQFEESKGKTLDELLDEFTAARERNLAVLREWALTGDDLEKTGRHPEFGSVKLRELLATWTVHDLAHLAQIARTMAKQYGTEVGPWTAYLSILKGRDE